MAQLPNLPGFIRDKTGKLSVNRQDPKFSYGQDDEGVDQFADEQDILAQAYERYYERTNLPRGQLGGGNYIDRTFTQNEAGDDIPTYSLRYTPPTPPAPVRPPPQTTSPYTPSPTPLPGAQPRVGYDTKPEYASEADWKQYLKDREIMQKKRDAGDKGRYVGLGEGGYDTWRRMSSSKGPTELPGGPQPVTQPAPLPDFKEQKGQQQAQEYPHIPPEFFSSPEYRNVPNVGGQAITATKYFGEYSNTTGTAMDAAFDQFLARTGTNYTGPVADIPKGGLKALPGGPQRIAQPADWDSWTKPGPTTPVTMAFVDYINTKTGERFSTNTGGFSPPPGSDWMFKSHYDFENSEQFKNLTPEEKNEYRREMEGADPIGDRVTELDPDGTLTRPQPPPVDPIFEQFTGPRTNIEKDPSGKYFREEITPEFKEFLTQRGYTVSEEYGLADGPDIIFNPQGQRVTFGPQGTGTATTTMRPPPTDPPPRGTVPDNLGKVTTGATATAAGLTDLPATLPPGTMIDPDDMIVQDEELFSSMRPADPIVGEEAAMVAASTAGINIATPPRQNAQTYSAYVQEGTPEYSAAQGQPSSESLIGDIQGAVSEQAVATAATGELDERATVKYQMDQLFDSFEEGKPPPAWAAPAVRAAGAMMAQRGMGKSSMAAAAITQAMMESGVSIAKEDANKYATIQITNLNNRQQASLQNALTFAAMDKANLNARMQAAVNNSRVFLQMDTANLTNQQQLKTIDLQSSYQKMFNDQAQENASRQFNAKSQMQVDQFFSELEVQVANANSSRTAAMSQFNADQTNAGKRYFAKINDARDRFNIQNEALIQQANASWRRSVNTANTAQRNEANRTNALNLLGYTQTAMDKVWQRYRDEASWAIQMSENDKQRAHNIAILAQQQAFDADQYGKDRDASFYDSVGNTVMNGIWGFLGA